MESKVYYKVLNAKKNHNGFQYKVGLNVDTYEFNPSGTCEKGGLYFTTENFLHKFLNYGCFIATITIPNDAKVYADPSGDKWKADRIYITKIEHISDTPYANGWIRNQTPESCLKAIQQYARNLQFVKNQTYELCLEAVKRDGMALEFVEKQTPELCLIAVKNFGGSLQFVKDKTHEICSEATKQREKIVPTYGDRTFKYTIDNKCFECYAK